MGKSLMAASGTIAVALAVTMRATAAPAPSSHAVSPPERTWSVVASPITRTLNSVALVDPGPQAGPVRDGWAIGDHGAITRYHDGAWLPYASPVTTTLHDVAVSPSGDAWAVGDDRVVLHFDGDHWVEVPHDIAADFTGVSVGVDGTVMATGNITEGGQPSGRAYVVNSDGLTEDWVTQYFRHSDVGVTFTDVAVWNRYYWVVVGTLPTQWGPGEVEYIHACDEPSEPPPLIGVIQCNDDGSTGGGYGVFALLAVDLVSRDGFYAAGRHGALQHNTGETGQRPVTAPIADYRSVAMVSTDEAWLATNQNRLVHVTADQGDWVPVAGLSPSATLRAVDVASTGEGWAVGSHGLLAHLTDQPHSALFLPWLWADRRR